MELKEVMEALDRIEGKMQETSSSNEAELKRLGVKNKPNSPVNCWNSNKRASRLHPEMKRKV